MVNAIAAAAEMDVSASSSSAAGSSFPVLEEYVRFPIGEKELIEVTEKAKDWAIMHGIAMRSKTKFSKDSLSFAPFLLTPSPLPKKEFEKAIHMQEIINRLMHNVAHDEEFLTTTLADTVLADQFTADLFNIYKKVLAVGAAQACSLGLLRSDYLLHSPNDNAIKQVEINTVASSFGGISTQMMPLQSFVLRELGYAEMKNNMPENKALMKLCEGMLVAWEIYGMKNAAIVFIIEDVSYNICDQRFHEFCIREAHQNIKVLRKTLTEVHKEGKLGLQKQLIIDNYEVAVVYFRAGYEPNHYPGEEEWEARYLIESSSAIKCPSIHYHLAGTKKVQQALAQPGVLERFLNDPIEIKSVSSIFTGLYSFEESENGKKVYDMALENPERFVLKPQREGGGNNIYGTDIPKVLKNMSHKERSAWILMDLIKPPITQGYMIRPDDPMPPSLVDVVSELGIFGVIIGKKDNIVVNYQAGHMLRTKLSTANEGGVAAGLGALDSPYLF